jgi:hypothetical protein
MEELGFFTEGAYRYYDTGESYYGAPASFTFSDPMLYYAADGRQLIPAEEWGGTMTLKDSLTLTIEADIKPHLRIEHELLPEEETILNDLLDAAYGRAEHTLNRGWEPGTVPAEVKLAIKQLVAFWYENRGDTSTTPEHVERTFSRYRFLPGL